MCPENNDVEIEIKMLPNIPIPKPILNDSLLDCNKYKRRIIKNIIIIGKNEVEGYDYIICPECGQPLHSSLTTHMMSKHGKHLNIKEIRNMYNTQIFERPMRTIPTNKLTREEFIQKYKVVSEETQKCLDSFKQKQLTDLTTEEGENNMNKEVTYSPKVRRDGSVEDWEVEGYDFIVCPECGRVLRSSLPKHIKNTHKTNLSIKEIRTMYGNDNLHSIPYIDLVKSGRLSLTREAYVEIKKKKGIVDLLNSATRVPCKEESTIEAPNIETPIVEAAPVETSKTAALENLIKTSKEIPSNNIDISDKRKYLNYLEIRMEKIKALFDTKIQKIERMLDELEEDLHQI